MNYSEFTNLYPLQKTLRFELIPVGNTLKKIRELQEGEETTLLQRDEKRAELYKKAKKMIDAYHRSHIEDALQLADFERLGLLSLLEEIRANTFQNEQADPETKKQARENLEKAQEKLRKEIVNILKGTISKEQKKNFTNQEISKFEEIKKNYDNLWRKKLFEPGKNQKFREAVLKEGFTQIEFDEIIENFKGFTTYFQGFQDNRENMYSEEAQTTAIAYRCVNENLPKFLNNIRVFEKVQNALEKEFKQAEKDLCKNQKLETFFSLSGFQNHLNQSGIERYNLILGGKFDKDKNEKIKGLNEYINLYNQKHPDARLPFFRPLYKQILAKTESASWRPEPFESDKEMLEAIKDFWVNHIQKAVHFLDQSEFSVLEKVKDLSKNFNDLSDKELEGIYVNGKRLSALSHQAFADWSLLRTALESKFNEDHKDLKDSELEKKRNSYLDKDNYSLLEIEEALKFYFETSGTGTETRNNRRSLKEFFSDLKFTETVYKETESDMQTEEIEKDLIAAIQDAYKNIEPVLDQNTDGDSLHQNKEKVKLIKVFLDNLKTLQRHLAYLHTEVDASQTNGEFYYSWDGCYEALSPLTQLYNKVRNRLTRKPFSEEKMKLNFDSPTLLNGWVESATERSYNGTQYGGYLFRKKNSTGEYDYYLGISKSATLFKYAQNQNIPESDKSAYERLRYYQLKDQTFYNTYCKDPQSGKSYTDLKKEATDYLKEYADKKSGPASELIKSYFSKNEATPAGCFKEIKKDNGNDFQKIINEEKFQEINENTCRAIIEGAKKVNLKLENTTCSPKKYYWELIDELKELLQNLKLYEYYNVSEKEFQDSMNNNSVKGLYLFRISNKDLNFAYAKENLGRTKKGRDNLHTIYFRHLMEGNQSVYDIGTGEVFYRKASLNPENTVIHKKNEAIRRRTSDAYSYFQYDIIKDRRYTTDKFLLHLSLKMNFTQKDNKINQKVHEFLRSSEKIRVIGIDRGERHLLYASLIDENGKILDQFSLNSISDVDYHEKLDSKEKDRKAARENWDVIENIKELKEGYLSQVVHRIAEMMVEHKAILVMEDLNFGFKRGRFKVEKQIYQKFEKMLIDKLNYLVFKDRKPGDPGGSLKAYQLTNKFESFQKLGRQSGMIFYVPASYTSKVDPVTGFYNFLNPKSVNRTQDQSFFKKFDSIRYNPQKGYFEFYATYGNFAASLNTDGKKKQSKKAKEDLLSEISGKQWIICSHETAERYRIKRTRNGSVSYLAVNCNQDFRNLLEKQGIHFEDGSELKDAIAGADNAEFLRNMIETLRVLLALRYNNGKKGADEKDYILSPVADSEGRFFNSLESDGTLPVDADANGAYHIAKKGLLLVRRIRSKTEDKIDLSISNHEWFHSLWK